MTGRYIAIRDIAASEVNNCTGRAVAAGESFDEYDGVTYGSCDEVNGVVVEYPAGQFSELPAAAVVSDDDYKLVKGMRTEGYSISDITAITELSDAQVRYALDEPDE